jgi:choline dehydrogenase-like flavoprotein
MILDGRTADPALAPAYDVLIVGAGPAGITLALELQGHGLRIGLLESGDDRFDPDTQMLYDGAVTGHAEAVDLAAIRLRYLGGATNHWGGRCVPMDRIDFERAPLSGLSGWPVSYDAMLPFYERAHPYFGIGRFVYDPLEIGRITRDDLLLPDAETLRTVVIRQSDLQFGPQYQRDLTRARDIDLWFWTNLVGFETGEDGAVTAVETRTLDGRARRFTARAVVLACGAVENTRQLLAHNARTGQRIGDAGDLLGRCYMDHPAGGAAFLWPERPLPPSVYWGNLPPDSDGTPVRLLWALTEETLAREGLANIQFYLLPFDEAPDPRIREANQGWRALRNVAKWAIGRDRDRITLSAAYCSMINNADMMAADVLGLIDRDAPTQRLLLKYEAEQLPDRASFVSLSGQRDALGQLRADLHWSPTEADLDSILRTTEIIGREAGAASFGRIEFESHFDEPYWNTNTSWHQMGTTRMAAEPRNGVVDPDCRVHGSANLYVAGGSVMPTGGRANPTLTIVALSIRLADHLKRRLAA